ncbi:MAG: hypothetical protein LBU87_03885 [Lactobacillales bacterium]|jgi:hypothetical protein|nr:hypothetical protein [Lactobacillales bacterium]
MKKILFLTVAGFLFASPAVWAQIEFSRPKTPVREAYVYPKKANYQDDLAKATELHNLLVELPAFREQADMAVSAENRSAFDKRRMDALDKCMTTKLGAYFAEPAAVWGKMKNTYDAKEKDLAIYLNSAQATGAAGMPGAPGTVSDQDITEQYMFWSLGNDILTDVYANQDNWGERKGPNTTFPIWKDQKYLYDLDWDKKYVEINTFFGVAPEGRPLINERRYDYRHYNDVVLAHNAYIAALSAAHPERAIFLPESLKQAPGIAPKPLPPARENVIYLSNPDGSASFFPKMPDPWQRFANGGFQEYNRGGEMARDFVGKTLRVKEELRQGNPDTVNTNTLNVYQEIKKEKSAFEKVLEVTKSNNDEDQARLKKELAKYKIPTENLNIRDPEQYNQVRDILKTFKTYFLDKAQQTLNIVPKTKDVPEGKNTRRRRDLAVIENQSPEAIEFYTEAISNFNTSDEARAQLLIDAMKKDADGTVMLLETNAAEIDQLMLEAKAVRELKKEIKYQTDQYNKEQLASKTVDAECLNKGDTF